MNPLNPHDRHRPGLLPTALIALAAALALAGCETSKVADPSRTGAAPVETRTPGTGAGAATAATPQSSVASVDLNKPAAGSASTAPLQRVVYFDFDSFVIKDDFKPLIEGHAKALSGARTKQLVVEGHTDERGGREYNLALGQKRAAAVVKTLTLLGVADGQLEAVSFGEERPAARGSDEQAWAQNRRAELKDR